MCVCVCVCVCAPQYFCLHFGSTYCQDLTLYIAMPWKVFGHTPQPGTYRAIKCMGFRRWSCFILLVLFNLSNLATFLKMPAPVIQIPTAKRLSHWWMVSFKQDSWNSIILTTRKIKGRWISPKDFGFFKIIIFFLFSFSLSLSLSFSFSLSLSLA